MEEEYYMVTLEGKRHLNSSRDMYIDFTVSVDTGRYKPMTHGELLDLCMSQLEQHRDADLEMDVINSITLTLPCP